MAGVVIAVPTPATSDLERFLDTLWRPGDVREVRIPTERATDAGYFDDPDALAAAVARYDGRENIYITLNPVEPSLLARAANRIKPHVRSTTSDVHILERRWLGIDVDPQRPTGVSASEPERLAALETARAVYAYLNGLDWPNPVTAMSGNGYWLMYPVELPNDDESRLIVEGVLAHLAERFTTPSVSIDTTVANASRIVALIGTLKVKGDATPDRPHRRSSLLLVPPRLVPVPRELLVALHPVAQPRRGLITVGRMPAGWVKKLLDDGGVAYREGQRDGRTWYRLERCPFHPDDDQGGDCGVGEDADGKALGHCFHTRGAGKGWRDFRAALGLSSLPTPLPVADPQQGAAKGMDAADLLALDLPPLRWIVPGIIPEGTTILAAPPKVGKSCLVYQIAVEASIGGDLLGRRVTPGSVLYLALEDGRRRGQDRLRAVLDGRTMPRGRLEVRWESPTIGQGLEDELAEWLDSHDDAVMVAIDTLGKVRPATDGRKGAYEIDVQHLAQLQNLFRNRTVALVIVHHARKEASDDFLASVSGTYGLTGSADTVVVIRRKRAEAYGQLQVTGRDVEDLTVSVRFDGLTWTEAPGVLTEGNFERTAVYGVIEKRGPVFAKAIGDELGIERSSVQHTLESLVASGAIARVPGGYITSKVTVLRADPPNIPLHSTHSKSEWGTGGDYARARAREADTGEWLHPCRDYAAHQSSHRKTPEGWICPICYPEGDRA